MLKNYTITVYHVGMLFYLFWLYFNAPKELSATFLQQIVIIAGVGLGFFLFKTENNPELKRQYLRISYLFLTGFFLVHFQIYIDYILGNYYNFGHNYLINESIVPKASVISTIALYCFNIGYLSFNNESYKVPRTKKSKHINLFGQFSLVLVLFLSFIILTPSAYFKGQYGQIDIGYLPTILQSYLLYAILGYIILVSYNYTNSGEKLTIKSFVLALGVKMLVLIGAYLVLVMISGDRGPIFQVVMVMVGGYLYNSKRKFKAYQIVLFGVIGVLVLAFMGLARTLRDEGSYIDRLKNVSTVQSTYSGMQSFSPNTMELGSVVRTMHAAVDYLDNHDYFYGTFQFFQIIAIFPGLGSLVMNITDVQPAEMNSAVFLSEQILGVNAYGLGTTCVADIYLDFGIIGVLFLFLFFGRFIRKQELNMFSNEHLTLFALILTLIFFSKAIYIGRSSIIIMFKDAFLTYFITLIGIYLSKFFKSSRG